MKYHSLRFHYMPQSFVCVLKVALHDRQVHAVEELEKVSQIKPEELAQQIASKVLANDLNYLLFRYFISFCFVYLNDYSLQLLKRRKRAKSRI